MHLLLQRLKSSQFTVVLAMAIMIAVLIHPVGLSDNMFTADAATLHSLEHIPIKPNSVSFTTNANYLQTLYAFVGKKTSLYQAGAEVFYSPTAEIAWGLLKTKYPVNDQTYVIISKYQLRQRPYSIDYWRISAYYDMNPKMFDNSRFFTIFYEDQNILVYSLVDRNT
jgi:hypothetical protein